MATGIRWIKGKDKVERAYGTFKVNGVRRGTMLRDYNDDVEPQTEKEAIAAMERFRAAMRSGKAVMPKVAGRDGTVEQFIERYVDEYWRVGEHSLAEPDLFGVVRKYFHNKPLHCFNDPNTFVTFFQWLRKTPIMATSRKKDGTVVQKPTTRKRAEGTIVCYRTRLRHMCAYAKAFNLIETDPFVDDRIRRFTGKKLTKVRRHRGVTVDEERALFAACDGLPPERGPRMRERLQMALVLGPRVSEMLAIQLEDINFDDWTLTIPGYKIVNDKERRNTKTGETRVVPIPDVLKPLFKMKQRLFDPKAFLFGDDGRRVTKIRHPWSRLKKIAKLDDAALRKQGKMLLHWHDLRGEAGTRMLRQGYSAEIVSKILGNTPEVLRLHYEGEMLDAMRKAVNAGAK